MYSIIGVSVVAVLLALLASGRVVKNGLEWSFVLLTIFLAIRYDFGNDYMSYLEAFQNYKSSGIGLFEFDEYYQIRNLREILWLFLNMLFKDLGFFSLIICATVFENIIIYRFIKKYVDREWYWLSVFVFTFNTRMMLVGASMVRQWLALCIFVLCIEFIQKKKPLPYFILMLVATQIHTSAWVLLPVYFIIYIPKKISKSFFYIAAPLFVLWIFFAPSLYSENLELLLQTVETEKYVFYLQAEKVSFSVIGLITTYLFPIICLTQINRVEEEKRLLFLIFALYILTIPLIDVTPTISRIGTYFYTMFLCVFPETLSCLKKGGGNLHIPLLILFLMLTLYNYFPFYSSHTFGAFYQEYHTIFSQPWQ